MATFNQITIVGRLGRDPEMKITPNGDACTTMSVATSKRKKGRDGQNEEVTTWFRVTLWRRQAEIANEYLEKGKLVYIQGDLATNEYEDRDGNNRFSLEVTATSLQFIDSSNSSEGGEREPRAERAPAPPKPTKAELAAALSKVKSAVVDSDIPF